MADVTQNLVIVESPAKARTIAKYLGPGYVVKSSVGHIRDLSRGGAKKASSATKAKAAKKSPKKTPQKRLAEKLSVDPYNGWKARYEIVSGKEKVLKELKNYAKKSKVIYLATDLDREGEAIAWHLKEALGGSDHMYKRVMFSEITRQALKKAFDRPTDLNMDRVRAQQTRRFLDRVVGFMVSPLLWAKVARGLSAGRVQSVAVRLIVEREKDIKSFLPEEYWQMDVSFEGKADLRAKVAKHQGAAYRPGSKKESDAHRKALVGAEAVVSKREDKAKPTKPSAPFITSTLQQAASQRLGFTVKKTMVVAQKLYESGLISYMRTDSTHLSDEALEGSRQCIKELYGDSYLPAEAQRYRSKQNAQEAHEAIRPSDFTKTPQSLFGSLEKDQRSLYDLIWKRCVASQMLPAIYDTTSVVLDCGDYQLRLSGRTLRFDGYQRLLPPLTSEANQSKGEEVAAALLASFKEGERSKIEKVFPHQHFTKPPPRFTEGRLVAELEKRGIGRPSTYASIISTIQDRGYVKAEQKKFYALKMGEVVTFKLQESFNDLMDFGFTAKMEQKLDDIASGRLSWQETLDQFFAEFTTDLDRAKEHMPSLAPTSTEISCPNCIAPMLLVTSTQGVFLSCSQRLANKKKAKAKTDSSVTEPSADKESSAQKEPSAHKKTASEEASGGCTKVLGLYSSQDFEDLSTDKAQKKKAKLSAEELQLLELRSRRRCHLCSSVMDSYVVDEKRKLHVCSQNPHCPGTSVEEGVFKLKGYDGPVIICDRCGADMQLKNGRFGKYFACTVCDNTRKLLKNGEVQPPKAEPVHMPELRCVKSKGYFILRDGAAGIFLASSAFPKSKETRKPKVVELVDHREELDPKYRYLADAPQQDPEGYDFLVKFSRINKEHYLASEEPTPEKKAMRSASKTTKWRAYYKKGKWELEKHDWAAKRSSRRKKPRVSSS